MENTNLEYEVKPLLVLVSRGTKAWCGRFVQTLRHVGWRVVATFLIGAAILGGVFWWEAYANDQTKKDNGAAHATAGAPASSAASGKGGAHAEAFAIHLLKEFAVAFLVSAIVIFAFEWGSEVKHSLDLAGNLANVLNTHIITVVNASAAEAIGKAMRQLAGQHAEGFTGQLRSFAESIQSLGGSGWAGQGYLQFMSWYYNEITGYAESLAHLSEKVCADPKSKAEFRLVLPEATVPIDVMLASITKAMTSSGTYYAISDVFTWTKLTDFQAAQRKELAEGLQIRRIFVVGKPSDVDVPAKEVSTRLYGHHDEAVKSGCRYRIRLTSRADFDRLAAPILKSTEHFGIFKPADAENHPIIVQVLDPQLLAFRIAGATEANAVLSAFRDLWRDLRAINCGREEDPAIDDDDPCADHDDGNDTRGHSPGPHSEANPLAENTSEEKTPIEILPEPSGTDMIRDHVMAYRMRQLPRSGKEGVWYHGASAIELWTSGALNQFEQAVIEAAEDGIEIKRLFIFEEQMPFDSSRPSKTFRTLRRHAEISQRMPNYQWRVIRRGTMPAELQSEPFALFRDGKNVEVEVARGSIHFGFGVPKAEATQLEEGFEELWTQFREPAARRFDPMAVIRAFDGTPWPNLTDDLRNQLKTYLDGVKKQLREEMERSIATLFTDEAVATEVIKYVVPTPLPRKERASRDDAPEDNEG
jgi:hypothetical protein